MRRLGARLASVTRYDAAWDGHAAIASLVAGMLVQPFQSRRRQHLGSLRPLARAQSSAAESSSAHALQHLPLLNAQDMRSSHLQFASHLLAIPDEIRHEARYDDFSVPDIVRSVSALLSANDPAGASRQLMREFESGSNAHLRPVLLELAIQVARALWDRRQSDVLESLAQTVHDCLLVWAIEPGQRQARPRKTRSLALPKPVGYLQQIYASRAYRADADPDTAIRPGTLACNLVLIAGTRSGVRGLRAMDTDQSATAVISEVLDEDESAIFDEISLLCWLEHLDSRHVRATEQDRTRQVALTFWHTVVSTRLDLDLPLAFGFLRHCHWLPDQERTYVCELLLVRLNHLRAQVDDEASSFDIETTSIKLAEVIVSKLVQPVDGSDEMSPTARLQVDRLANILSQISESNLAALREKLSRLSTLASQRLLERLPAPARMESTSAEFREDIIDLLTSGRTSLAYSKLEHLAHQGISTDDLTRYVKMMRGVGRPMLAYRLLSRVHSSEALARLQKLAVKLVGRGSTDESDEIWEHSALSRDDTALNLVRRDLEFCRARLAHCRVHSRQWQTQEAQEELAKHETPRNLIEEQFAIHVKLDNRKAALQDLQTMRKEVTIEHVNQVLEMYLSPRTWGRGERYMRRFVQYLHAVFAMFPQVEPNPLTAVIVARALFRGQTVVEADSVLAIVDSALADNDELSTISISRDRRAHRALLSAAAAALEARRDLAGAQAMRKRLMRV
ncbi:uncharacterized protein L969DRAFT_53688 [Mixia osmundae IAM 14324]|uniref:Uncharacterized protein n=1 Tax=Mixia osmundae (strain CBS 9802 / IAM 14324 / JCM 22182 / KY 12970) TaxID=764103 RepID=G7DSV4_MIXOS|nr:uncharacterized protein L969DRAFT_53688 [Mixia osmundae IAM 14324]KEI37120.1 hypothetical protein L969DRAFT_53688 [Mixia osmundae IAM 14324]GAA93664.1 hypothetical protein E5Q_00309 [Mixia osmundae IAM 14324]